MTHITQHNTTLHHTTKQNECYKLQHIVMY